jgi:hypothetical protein
MLNRLLFIALDGKPIGWCCTYGEARDLIIELADDDVDLIKVWRVYPSSSLTPATDATEDFAADWASRCSGDRPAFVRVHHQVRKSA